MIDPGLKMLATIKGCYTGCAIISVLLTHDFVYVVGKKHDMLGIVLAEKAYIQWQALLQYGFKISRNLV